ncbi:hypothetical protein FN976_11465 [Caenimonas sedimenti]|uniref:Uncharacterized protein n=1 Tax=Caenimonas sedimenti TaxID=2596921 RepID=A0A562ZTA6_9BURK|nr:hypothetical protein [Caenimonas sedimenti]TWO71525.1 hypothetical protein FN976_11465 [Caenimonas sedimenti]
MLVFEFPDAARAIGRLLMTLAVAAALLGWRGHKLLAVLDRRLAKVGVDAPRSLAEAYPTLPTWWIPESGWGFALVGVVFALGAALALAARTAKRMGA